MASNVESGFYWMGFASGFNGKSWTRVPYAPGTRAYHQYLEGHSDGLKGRHLQRHGHRAPSSTHHAHGHGYHAH